MKRILLILLVFLLGPFAFAQQEDLLVRIRTVNLPPTLEASWLRTSHSPLLQEELTSSGKLYLQEPGKLRWETLKPVSSLTVYDGTEKEGRFRMPSEKDFSAQILESEQYTVTLEPLQRYLKQMFSRIILTVDKSSLLVREVLIVGLEGEWTRLEFTQVSHPESFPETLFKKP